MRWVASLEAGAITRATSSAMSTERSAAGAAANHCSAPQARATPSTAATCPCGRLRSITKASSTDGTATPPRNRTFRPSITSAGSDERLGRVRFLTLLASREDSRSRIAGGELRLGTCSMYMNTNKSKSSGKMQENDVTWLHRSTKKWPKPNADAGYG